ncbi:MAG: hypothetical protein SGPRY_008646, partial [Prymnesium sp.]
LAAVSMEPPMQVWDELSAQIHQGKGVALLLQLANRCSLLFLPLICTVIAQWVLTQLLLQACKEKASCGYGALLHVYS